jgi:acyl carrier protein
MKWTISETESPLTPHAMALYSILKSTDDIELKVPIDTIKLDQHLKNDLGMDSIQIVSILYELESQYPHLNEQMVANWKTIKDILISMSERK